MKLYKYDFTTKEYVATIDAQKRPNGKFITDVLNCTTVEPPIIKEKETLVWNGNSWKIVEDHRKISGIEDSGTPYWLPEDTWNSQPRYMTELGPLPEVALLSPPEKDIDTIRKEKLSEINGNYNSAVSTLVSTYPETELLTFDKQEKEAREYKKDNSSSTPFLKLLAEFRGITLDELIDKVIIKADLFQENVAKLTGLRQKYEDELDKCETKEDIEKINTDYTI